MLLYKAKKEKKIERMKIEMDVSLQGRKEVEKIKIERNYLEVKYIFPLNSIKIFW